MTSWGWFPRSKATVAKPVFGKKDRAVFLSPCQQCLNVGVEGSDFLCNELLCRRHVSSLPYPLPYPSVLSPPPPFSLSLPAILFSWLSFPAHLLGCFWSSLCYGTAIGFISELRRKQLSGCHLSSDLRQSRMALGLREMLLSGWVRGGVRQAPPTPHPPVFLNWALLEGSQCLLGASLGLLGALLGFLERGGHESTISKYGFS